MWALNTDVVEGRCASPIFCPRNASPTTDSTTIHSANLCLTSAPQYAHVLQRIGGLLGQQRLLWEQRGSTRQHRRHARRAEGAHRVHVHYPPHPAPHARRHRRQTQLRFAGGGYSRHLSHLPAAKPALQHLIHAAAPSPTCRNRNPTTRQRAAAAKEDVACADRRCSATMRGTGRLLERCSDSGEHQGAKEAPWGVCQQRTISSLSEAGSWRSWLTFQHGGVVRASKRTCCSLWRAYAIVGAPPAAACPCCTPNRRLGKRSPAPPSPPAVVARIGTSTRASLSPAVRRRCSVHPCPALWSVRLRSCRTGCSTLELPTQVAQLHVTVRRL